MLPAIGESTAARKREIKTRQYRDADTAVLYTSLVEKPVGQALRKTVWNLKKNIKDPYPVTLQIHSWAFIPEKCQWFPQNPPHGCSQ